MNSKISKKRQSLRYFSLLRKRRRSNQKRRIRNIERGKIKTSTYKESKKPSLFPRQKNVLLNPGTDLTLFENPENLIQLVSDLEVIKHKHKSFRYNIGIDLSEILRLDIGALSFLLAKISEMAKISRFKIWGLMPKDPYCKEVFIKSGFLEYMRDLSGRRFEKHNSDSFLIDIGSQKTLSEKVGLSIKKSYSYLTGNEDHYPPIYCIVGEMCSNSVEHANPSNKNWFFGMQYVDSNDHEDQHVVYTVADVGFGILNTLKRKFGTKFFESFKGDDEILFRAYERQYGSQTEEINRNRGLPIILERIEKQYIRDLKVITNHVLLDFENRENSKILSKSLPGTFYSWKLDCKCIEIWKKQLLN